MVLLVSRQPVGPLPFETQPAELQRVQPDRFERRQQLVWVVLLGPAQNKRCGDHRSGLQRPDGRLAVVAEQIDQFVDDLRLVFLARSRVTPPLL